MTASLMTHGPLNEASFTSTELPSAHACKQTIKLQTDYMLVYQQQKDLRQVCVSIIKVSLTWYSMSATVGQY